MTWMSGGATYGLDELREAPAVGVIESGIASFDAVFPGLRAGSMCAIVGMRGAGVTELAMTYTRQFAASPTVAPSRAVFMNGHLPGDVLANRLAGDPAPQGDVVVASWLGLPGRNAGGEWDWIDCTVARAGLVVYDTIDESFPALHERVGRRERVWAMRDLRDAARASAKIRDRYGSRRSCNLEPGRRSDSVECASHARGDHGRSPRRHHDHS